MIKRFRKWKDWRKYNNNSWFYQFLVLIGVRKSLYFDTWYM